MQHRTAHQAIAIHAFAVHRLVLAIEGVSDLLGSLIRPRRG